MKKILSENETSTEVEGGTVWKAVEGVHWGSSRVCGSCDGELNDGRKTFSVK